MYAMTVPVAIPSNPITGKPNHPRHSEKLHSMLIRSTITITMAGVTVSPPTPLAGTGDEHHHGEGEAKC